MSPTKRKLLTLFSLLIYGGHAWAAACCGSGLSAPALVLGDDKAQVTLSYSYAKIQDDVEDNEIWVDRASSEIARTYRLDAATLIGDRWQVGASVPFVERLRADQKSSGFGDVAFNLGYEYLPDWDYNPWRPRGLGYFELVAPTAKSVQQSDNPFQLDSRGRGFWEIGLGSVLTKVLGRFDVSNNIEVHKSFAAHFSNASESGMLEPGFGGSLGFGAGLNGARWRVGLGLTWTYEDPIRVTGDASDAGGAQRFATGLWSASYIPNERWAISANYGDQTLFGSPVNTTLSRSFLVSLQMHWPR